MRVFVTSVALLCGCSTVSGLDDFSVEGASGGGTEAAGGGDSGGATMGGGAVGAGGAGGGGGDKGDCPSPWVPATNGNCYLMEQVLAWPAAVDACVMRGGNLAALTTPNEIAIVEVTLGVTGDNWIGGRRNTGDQFQWITGEPWTYTNGQDPWASSSEPNNDGGNEDCVELRANDGLNDRPCDVARWTICEWEIGG